MTCEEFERVLPELGNDHSIEQDEHMKSCSTCSELVSDLNEISKQGRLLQGCEEPSPWVWNSIEVALRQEGLIREQPGNLQVHPPRLSWKLRWLVPAAAASLIFFGVLLHERGGIPKHQARQESPAGVVTADLQTEGMPSEDMQLLNSVAARTPSMRDAYEQNLRAVNAYIHDAEQSANNDPNDEVAQQYLRNAYEQKAMVYEMALDRSLQ
jgi:hypothetical protein